MQATYKKHLEVTKLLLDRGSDIEAVDNVSHFICLFIDLLIYLLIYLLLPGIKTPMAQ